MSHPEPATTVAGGPKLLPAFTDKVSAWEEDMTGLIKQSVSRRAARVFQLDA